jgi:hypothetical protein
MVASPRRSSSSGLSSEHLQDQYLQVLGALLTGFGKFLFEGISRSSGPPKLRRKSKEVIKHLEMKLIGGKTVRRKFLNAIGLGLVEVRPKESLFGPLDELKASNLLSGPFKLSLTKNPAEHLTFVGSHSRSTVRLLDLGTIFRLYAPQRCGLMRYHPSPDF